MRSAGTELVEALHRAVALVGDAMVGERWNATSVASAYTVGGLATHLLLVAERVEHVVRRGVGTGLAAGAIAGCADGELAPGFRVAAEQAARRGHALVAARLASVVERLELCSLDAWDAVPSDYVRARVEETLRHVEELERSCSG